MALFYEAIDNSGKVLLHVNICVTCQIISSLKFLNLG